jgi:hypothetical protein
MKLMSSADKNSKHKTFHADEIEKPETTSPKKKPWTNQVRRLQKYIRLFRALPCPLSSTTFKLTPCS